MVVGDRRTRRELGAQESIKPRGGASYSPASTASSPAKRGMAPEARESTAESPVVVVMVLPARRGARLTEQVLHAAGILASGDEPS